RYTEPAASRARCRSRVQIPPLSAPPAAAASKFIAVPLNGAWRGELEAKPVHDESLVTIQGRALYRRNAELQELEVDNAALVEEDQGTDLPTAATMPITDQFATIAQLGAGWLDGRGDAYNADVVASIRRVLEGLVDRYALARPFVYPTPDNEVRVEW